MPDHIQPDVYVEEQGFRPPRIESDATAVPCFIGYTAKATRPTGEALTLTPTRITSLNEFEQLFGTAFVQPLRVSLKSSALVPGGVVVDPVQLPTTRPVFALYWSLKHYFDNGGGPCFIVSVGLFGAGPTAGDLLAGISASESEPAITLVLVPDQTALDYASFTAVVRAQLRHCVEHRRFAILGLWHGDVAPTAPVDTGQPSPHTVIEANRAAWDSGLAHGAAYYPHLLSSYSRRLATPEDQVFITRDGVAAGTLADVATQSPAVAQLVRQTLDAQTIVLPPEGAVAGVYARVDTARGVWKAPASESLASVVGPCVQLTDSQQQPLNVDATSGKSINAIRQFTGKGTLVWGARTLAGNDNEWRYVPVRRLMDHVERSIRRGTTWVVFEPNDPPAWVKLVGAVDDFLIGLWRAGGLIGATSREAFFVRCGVGQTMTEADVQAGRVVLLVGLAAVRPAEFVVLRIEYAVQQP